MTPALDVLPDQGLQDERRGAFLELQFFVVQGFGVGTTLGGSLAEQHNAIVVSQRQRALENGQMFFRTREKDKSIVFIRNGFVQLIIGTRNDNIW